MQKPICKFRVQKYCFFQYLTINNLIFFSKECKNLVTIDYRYDVLNLH